MAVNLENENRRLTLNLQAAKHIIIEKDAAISELVGALDTTLTVFVLTNENFANLPGVLNARALIAKHSKEERG